MCKKCDKKIEKALKEIAEVKEALKVINPDSELLAYIREDIKRFEDIIEEYRWNSWLTSIISNNGS